MMSWKCPSMYSKGIHSKEPPRAEPHAWWCERSENESRKKTTSFSSYSIYFTQDKLAPKAFKACSALENISILVCVPVTVAFPI